MISDDHIKENNNRIQFINIGLFQQKTTKNNVISLYPLDDQYKCLTQAPII